MGPVTGPLDTRARILDAAWQIVSERGVGELTLTTLASDVGLSRQAIYLHISNRAGLLAAMADQRDERHDLAGKLAAAAEQSAPEDLEQVLAVWLAHLPRVAPVLVALEAAARAGEPEAVTAFDNRGDEVRKAFRASIKRLADGGRLAEGWSVDEAADWVTAATAPAAWMMLRDQRRWSNARITRRLSAVVLSQLVASAPAAPSGPARRGTRKR
jgi:AcrR family transcriptional regulator